MANYFLPTLESHKLVSLLYHFHRDVACAQAKNTHAAIADIYFTEPLRDCRRLNILREYDNENTKLHS